ncbi:hypothetical protein AB0O34_32655, partial [Sphaerisporangium sp. NPDC088356]|uniref:hypothetical protein n=1 Tax=Sphaerisporangium sp. NPDC088356 TaxID=3154871 RepID=UPI003428AD86
MAWFEPQTGLARRAELRLGVLVPLVGRRPDLEGCLPHGFTALCLLWAWQEAVRVVQLAAVCSSGLWVVIPAELFVREQ